MAQRKKSKAQPKGRAKRIKKLGVIVRDAEKALSKGFVEAFYYSGWFKNGNRRVRHFTVQSQAATCRRKLNKAKEELAAITEGAS